MALRAFTLVELLVVLICLGLIAMLGVGALPDIGETRRLQTAAADVRAAFVRARAEAILSGRPVEVVVDIDQRVLRVPGENRPVRLPGNANVMLRTAADQVVGEKVGRIVFRADGTSAGGSLELSNPAGRGYDIDVNWLTGRVSMHAR